jgi:hypothetical protein
MKWVSAAALVAATLVTAACADSKPAAPPATAPAATVAPATTAPAATVATVGVRRARVRRVHEQVDGLCRLEGPAEARAQYKAAIDASKASWKQAASTPQGKAVMAQSCTQQLAATKQALAAYNCTW